jgi:hypothetical protein
MNRGLGIHTMQKQLFFIAKHSKGGPHCDNFIKKENNCTRDTYRVSIQKQLTHL